MDDAGQASTDRWSITFSDAKQETNMNTINRLAYPLVAVLALVSASSAFAESPTPDNTATVEIGSKSRAQVQAELFQARQDGSIKVWSTTYNPLTKAQSLRSREEVQAEASRGYDFDRTWYGEDSGSFALNRRAPAREAGPVYAGAAAERNTQ